MKHGVPYTRLAGAFKKLDDARWSAECGHVRGQETGIGRKCFREERGVACHEGFLRLQFNFSYVVHNGVGDNALMVIGPEGCVTDGTAGDAKGYNKC